MPARATRRGNGRGRRRRRCWRCSCGKTAYSRWRVAEQAVARQPERGRIYWAPCGGWHITRLEPGEYDRRRAPAGRES